MAAQGTRHSKAWGPDAGRRGRYHPRINRLLTGLLAGAVGLAFADASVVVLALPAMYGEYDTTIVGVSWVITAYGLALSLTGLALAALPERGGALHLTVVGLGLFAGSSVGCAAAPDLGWLIAGRAAQGVGAALLLVGSLHLLQTRLPGTGQRLWGSATTVGLALGPALGGVLTELFDWRAIFIAQAPVAAAALAVGFARGDQRAEPRPERATSRAETTLANAGLLFVSGALVGALFLGVLVIIEVWRFSPIEGAVVVSTLPLGALAAGVLRRRAAAVARGLVGPVVLATGLVALAYLPSAGAWWAAAALGLCGAGLGLTSAVVDIVTDREWSAGRRAVGLEVGCRHAGLVLGLLLIAPLLAGDLDRGSEQATLSGAALVLDARIPLGDKLDVADAVRTEVDETPRGQVPDIQRAFEGTDEATLEVGVALQDRIAEVLTRAFRAAFLVAAGLALAAAIPTVLFAARSTARWRGSRAGGRCHRSLRAVGRCRRAGRGRTAVGRWGLRCLRAPRPVYDDRRPLPRAGPRRHRAAHSPRRARRRRLRPRDDPGGAGAVPPGRHRLREHRLGPAHHRAGGAGRPGARHRRRRRAGTDCGCPGLTYQAVALSTFPSSMPYCSTGRASPSCSR